MGKRFTDTEKWRDEWWGALSNDYRMIWLYLVDSCSIAGIWKKDFRGLNFNCNTNITEEDFLKHFGDRLVDKGNFFFIPKFLRFQCPKGLNSNKPAILSIVKELEQNNLTKTVIQSLGNDFLIIKDKGKGTRKDRGEGKEKTEECNFIVIGDEVVTNPLPRIEFYEAQMNALMREVKLDWRTQVTIWFNQHLAENFKDDQHVKNSFKKFYMELKPNGTYRKETLTAEQILAKAPK